MSFRTLSSEIFSFSLSTNFSCASVGPKPLYFVFNRFKARFFTSADKRLLLFRPRCFDTNPAAPFWRYAFSKRLIWRVLKPKICPASFCLMRFSESLCITSKRLNSFVLISSSLSISCPFLKGDILTLVERDISTLG